MAWINYEIFADKWLERAERRKVFVDDGDRFISLWIAFNGWMKGKYGEDKTGSCGKRLKNCRIFRKYLVI